MHTIDFTTALARLLHDGAWRDSFREDPLEAAERLKVRAEDRAAFLSLSVSELEAQADTLLRKRIDRVKCLAPELCAALGEKLWPQFREYARSHWPEEASDDALHFCERFLTIAPGSVSPAELKRLQFITSGRLVRVNVVRPLGVQFLFRARDGRVRETRLYLRL